MRGCDRAEESPVDLVQQPQHGDRARDAMIESSGALPSSQAQRASWLLSCLGYTAVLGLLLVGTLAHEPYDDAYFFKRMAVHALEHHGFSWNVDEGPVYGATS